MIHENRGFASIYSRGGKILILPSGYFGSAAYTNPCDALGLFLIAMPDSDLGHWAREALFSSKPIPLELAKYDKKFNEKLTLAFGLKSMARLYSNVKYCSVRWFDGTVSITPTRRRHGGGFEGFSDLWPDKADVVVPFDVSDEALGAAVREALRRSV